MRIAALLLLLSGVAHADGVEAQPKTRDWHLGVEVLTDFPLYIGAQVWVELPHRIRLSTSFGDMPDLYLDTINSIAVSAGAYNNATAEFLSELLDRAFTWRLHAGWRPFKRRGAYFEVGYGILELHGSTGVLSVIQLATGFTAPFEPGIGFEYHLNTLVQTVGVEVGWMWYPRNNLTVRFSLGFAAVVNAHVDIEPNFLASKQRIFTRLASDYAEQLIERHLFIPTIGLAVGWRLF
jgi:hypothetical protein